MFEQHPRALVPDSWEAYHLKYILNLLYILVFKRRQICFVFNTAQGSLNDWFYVCWNDQTLIIVYTVWESVVLFDSGDLQNVMPFRLQLNRICFSPSGFQRIHALTYSW